MILLSKLIDLMPLNKLHKMTLELKLHGINKYGFTQNGILRLKVHRQKMA